MSPLVAYGTGWLAAAALVCAVPLPLSLALLRRLRGRGLGRPEAALRRRLGVHYRLGAAAAALGLLHGLVSITRARLAAPAEAGLWLACGAAAGLVFETVLGARVRQAAGAGRSAARGRHLVGFLAVLLLVGLHVALDGPLPP